MVTKKVMGVEVDVPDTPQRQTILSIAEADESEHQKLSRRMARIERRSGWNTILLSIATLETTLVGIYVGYKAATQQATIIQAIESNVTGYVDSKLRQHLDDSRQGQLDTAREALRLERAEREAVANPAPIQRAPDTLAARGPKR